MKNRKFHFCVILFLSMIPVVASGQKQNTRSHQNFDANWKFSLGNAADAKRDFDYGIGNIFSKSGETAGTCIATDFKDSTWANVRLPHDWVVALPFQYVKNDDIDSHGYKPVGALFPQNSIGWYRKTFTVNKADSGKRYEIQFDGIYRDSKVWLNGYYIGGHSSGYNSFAFDITDFIKFGKSNVMVVRADATQSEGWFYEGAGIYRHAWLNSYNNVHFKTAGGLFAHAEVADGKAQVKIEADIENRGINAAAATLYSYITDRDGKIIAKGKQIPFTEAIRENKLLVDEMTIINPRLWSLDDAYLYRAVSLIKANGQTIDSINVKFGVRTFKFDSEKGFFLNGKPLKVQGVSCHQDHAGVGSALPDELQYYRIRLLKEMGVNAYRTTHNPPTPELLDACDSLGMLVMDETRLLTSGQEYEQQYRDLILRDRNHASIFMWSIGNEEYVTQRTDIGKRIAQNQILLQQQLDPTRTSTYAANMGNVYRGVNEVIPVRGFNYNLLGIDAYHKEHPLQPIIGTEVASTVTTRSIYVKDTVRAYVPDYDVTFPSWASTAETWWKIADARPWFMGGFAWTGFDYRGEPTPYRWPNINSHFGIMDMCGFPKNVYYYYQSWWTDKDILHIAPHWNWKGKEGKPIDVWVNTNADDVELYLNGKSLGKKEMPRNSHLVWTVNYEPGKLVAVAHKKGKVITAKVETTGAPYSIVLSPSKKILTANGEDAVVINASVVDKNGREVPDALNMLHFDIKGDAQIIGVGNGDPSSHEADKCLPGQWQRSLFGGKAQLIVLSGMQAGSFTVVASGAGIKSNQLPIIQK
ncbi:beta-galactosidase [Mucilaginibacter gracilis]|uniref:Beta-galactosidase n=1 Tax=Mucilaginibacter gracilis TaxID=423350 RepID=A0A495J752_9SPHI|nr:beta-galactosidase GalA [Mucilaginibacter gracilis]RKR84573.1 beta-galactosidase [Mucilaginibacter gracilis]